MRLAALRIDRAAPTRRGRHAGALVAAGGVALLGLGWYLHPSPPRSEAPRAADRASLRALPPATLDASGYVVAGRQATVSARIAGQIVQVLVAEGQRVRRGETIALLDASGLAAARQQAEARLAEARALLRAARVARDNAGPLYRRSVQLHGSGWMSGATFDAAKARYDATGTDMATAAAAVAVAQADLAARRRDERDAIVRAPFAGVVIQKNAQPGEIVSPLSAGGFTRTGIATIVDPRSLQAEIEVAEAQISRVRAGAAATVRLSAYPEWGIPARVAAIIPAANRAKGTVRVRIDLLARDPRILPEMALRVALAAPRAQGGRA